MKLALSILFIGLVNLSFGQDSTTVKKPGQMRITTTSSKSLPKVSLRRIKEHSTSPSIVGQFIIEQYSLQVKSSAAKKAKKTVGTKVEINESFIFGSKIDSIDYKIIDSEKMNTEDYLFRVFKEVPKNIPADLPLNILVHKTNNADCYGIAELIDGTILIPYNGLLLYLKRH